MPSLNFAAFADVAPQVAHYGRLAEQALHRDPEVAVWRVRQVIESLVAWQEHLAGVSVDRESLHQRIETLRGRNDAFGEVDVTARRLAYKGLTAIRKSAWVRISRFCADPPQKGPWVGITGSFQWFWWDPVPGLSWPRNCIRYRLANC